MKKPSKPKLWIYNNPSVRIPHFLIKSDTFKKLPPSAVVLYLLMRMADHDTSPSAYLVSFGPSDVKGCMHKPTYYSSLSKLIQVGLVEVIQLGTHGRKGIFDLTTTKWVSTS